MTAGRHTWRAELGGWLYDHRVAFVVGTRPEAIKLAPLANAMLRHGVWPRLILTGQHPDLRPEEYGMPPLERVALECGGLPDPHSYVGLVARKVRAVAGDTRLMIVQGDTSSALGGALGAVQAGVPVAHVEAGLRSHDRLNPWPEEEFRIAIDRVSDLLFAPTELNAANLRREAQTGHVHVTGNTGIDALLELIQRLPAAAKCGAKRRLLITCHRRESWGEGLQAIASCMIAIGRRPDVELSVVLHSNPRVADEMRRLLGSSPNLTLHSPCGHLEMLRKMQDSDLILSDSGGMQEEAPALGVPLLVLRDRTERPEGVASGNVIMAGRDSKRILDIVERLLGDPSLLTSMSAPALPYGDGHAAERIAAIIEGWLIGDLKVSEPRSPSSRSATAPAAPSLRYASRM
ncbi:MAG: UDP-N-acetylglucosamine 2-epimerase (non-hydrolyzing) [Sphingomonas sp.]|nr:UDP-N-acetylglucosamine 2-epimerase (non-hydrolyzing) [Sphingomonas sp.]